MRVQSSFSHYHGCLNEIFLNVHQNSSLKYDNYRNQDHLCVKTDNGVLVTTTNHITFSDDTILYTQNNTDLWV